MLHPIDQQRKVVDDVSLKVRRGEIVGIAGLMGAGRTELAMSVFGRSYGQYAGGTVLKDGREIRTRTVPEAVGHGIAYVTEDRKQLRPQPHRRHQPQHLAERPPQGRAARRRRRARGDAGSPSRSARR